jgi:hypothetical protein
MPWRLPQHLSVADSRRVFKSYTKIGDFRRNMQMGVHNANQAAAAAEYQRLQNADNRLTRNLAEQYGITQHQIYANMFATLEGHLAQTAVARNVGAAGRAWQNRKAGERANAARTRARTSPILRELVAIKYNPSVRANRIIRRPYAKSVSPRKSTRSPLRRTMSAPLKRSKSKAPSPHRREMTIRNIKRVMSETLNSIRPSNSKKARRA